MSARSRSARRPSLRTVAPTAVLMAASACWLQAGLCRDLSGCRGASEPRGPGGHPEWSAALLMPEELRAGEALCSSQGWGLAQDS